MKTKTSNMDGWYDGPSIRPTQKKGQIASAIEYLVSHHGVTYRQAAARFGVSVNELRARINYRHGSLAGARLHKDFRQKNWTRPCIICASVEPRPVGQYRCDTCRGEGEKIYDGVL